METVTLKATQRTESGKGPSRRLRAKGRVPAVAYGAANATETVSVDGAVLRDILLSERGRNSIIKLDIEGGSKNTVMVKDYSVHPLSRALLHADFIHITEQTKVTVNVPFRSKGRSIGEGTGGTLLVNVRSLKMRCLPAQIPQVLEYDVSAMEVDDVVKVKQLEVPEGVELLLPQERTLLMVAPPRVEVKKEEDDAKAEGAEAAEGAVEGEASK